MNKRLERGSVLSYDRRQELLDQLRERKTIRISEAAGEFHIGEATIRRDLEKLEKQGLARRIYGGAVLLEGLDAEIPMDVREKTEQAQKESIGRLAASIVEDGDVLILDSSSSTLAMISFLMVKKDLTIITNGLKAADMAGDLGNSKVYCCGGRLRELSKSLVGMSARKFIRSHSAGKLFFSCRAVNLEMGVCDSSDEEAELRQDMIASCKKAILLAASSKFNGSAFCQICGFEDIDVILTDLMPDEQWMKHLSNFNVRLIQA
jgi:DeoR/GlpR family transcriptional regulator of sugar metabolism